MSMRRYITICIVLFASLSLFVSFALINIYERNILINRLIESTESGAELLGSRISYDGESLSSGGALAIDQTADMAGGRALIIDDDYRVIYDTSGELEGRYVVSGRFIDFMQGGSAGGSFMKDGNVFAAARSQGFVAILISPISGATSVNKSVIVMSGLIFVLVLALSFIFAQRSAHRAVRDLTRINEEIKTRTEGNFYSDISSGEFAEVRKVADSYNTIIKRLGEVDQGRQEFVSNVSHELKTPMTSMKVLAESVVGNENVTAEDYQEFMSDIITEIDRETELINDLLMLVKTEKKNVVMNIKEADIGKLIEIVLKRVQPIADARGIVIQYNAYKDVTAQVDEVKMILIISNIVTNAVKYNIDGGSVRISLNSDNKYFYIKVADTGVGIPDDEKDKIFDRFYRVDKTRSRETGGTGLGLAIARNLIYSHDGTIKLYSEFGQGTTFTIKIPLTNPGYVKPEEEESEQDKI